MSNEDLVFEGGQRLVTTRIALAAAPAKELAVDATSVMVLRGDHMEATGPGNPRSEPDVGTAAGHVGGHRDPAGLPGLRHDRGFLTVLARVEHAMPKPREREARAQLRGGRRRACPEEHRTSTGVDRPHTVDDGPPPRLRRGEDAPPEVPAAERPIRRDAHHSEPVDGPELLLHLP